MKQMDVYGKVIFNTMPIAENLIAGYCFYRFLKPFTSQGRKVLIVAIAYFFTILTLYLMPMEIGNFAAYGIGILAAFLVMCLIERKNYWQKVFLSVTFFALRSFTSASAEILYDRLYALAENTAYMRTHPDMWFALYIGVCMVYLALEAGFMLTAVWCISKSYKDKYERISVKEMFLLILPSLIGVVGHEIIWHYCTFYMRERGEPAAVYDFLSVIYHALAVVTIVVMIVLYQSIRSGQKERLYNEMLAVQLENTGKHIEQVENLYKNIRSIKHDMTNHIITLERLYAGNKEAEAKAYSEELKEALSEAGGRINSGNPVTDVILQKMKDEAEERHIKFEMDFHYPEDSNMNAFDISVILNNALSNALEYTDKDNHPVVSVLSYRRNNAYMIEISNSFGGSLRLDEESGLPMTTKEKIKEGGAEKIHGYGISNIRRVAEKYSGDIVIDLKDGMFCLSILLMMENP